METQSIASLEKNTVETKEAASACCAQPADSSPCCTPSVSKTDNDGDCCAQPSDGAACCDK